MAAGGRTLSTGPVVVMGVSGSGKTTVGRLVAERLGVEFADGDDLHPPANVESMARGIPLDDAARAPWLAAVAGWLDAHPDGVIACSALRRRYRDVLRRPGLLFAFLDGSPDVLLARLQGRRDHFMPATLLDSQLATLEPPGPDEDAIRVDITRPLEEQVEFVERAVRSAPPPATTRSR